MRCPRCAESVLEERAREGVTVDACRTCYGVWLDRGELERLVARARDEIEQLERRERPARSPEPWHEPLYAPRPAQQRARWDDDEDDHRHRHGHGHKRKRWFEALGDIFD
jgi:Zn-finger nucleic acid-binding protein